jgi:phosphinothricin acetyltransferase
MVRHADPARDGAACAAIYAPHVSEGLASFETVPPDGEQMAARIAATARTHPWLVAERDGAVAGYAYASPHHTRAGYRWTADAAVYVSTEHRREGVGRELYAALLGLLERQRLHVVCAGIALPNPGSVALHEAMGFEPVGVYRAIGYKHGAWLDVGWWQLRLRPAVDGPPPEPLGPRRL